MRFIGGTGKPSYPPFWWKEEPTEKQRRQLKRYWKKIDFEGMSKDEATRMIGEFKGRLGDVNGI